MYSIIPILDLTCGHQRYRMQRTLGDAFSLAVALRPFDLFRFTIIYAQKTFHAGLHAEAAAVTLLFIDLYFLLHRFHCISPLSLHMRLQLLHNLSGIHAIDAQNFEPEFLAMCNR